jgi:ankyrin repeat protein
MRSTTVGSSALPILFTICGSGLAASQPTPPSPTPTPSVAATAPAVETIDQAAMKGDLEVVRKLVSADPALVNAPGENGITPFALAAAFGHVEVVRFLLERGADVNARDRRGITALHVAVWRNRPEIVRLLLEKGADDKATGPGGLTPLHMAAMNAQIDIAGLLIERKAAVDARTVYGNSALHLAAAANVDDVMARLLVEAGADVNAANALDGTTPLDLAQREQGTAVAQFLRSRGGKASSDAARALRGPYLGQSPPGVTPVLFAPNLVSTENSELCAVFSPDETEFYFARRERERGVRMRTVTREGGIWRSPRLVAFAGDYSSVDMFMTRDGQRLYYCSNRALDGKGAAKTDTDIWVAIRAAGGWSEPVNLGDAVNSGENDYYPTLTAKGDLYFSSPRAGGMGGNDLYRARVAEGQFGRAENLGSPINTDKWEFDPFIAPDESFILFASNRPGNVGDSDLYVSFHSQDGSWATPENMGEPINSVGPEYTPMMSPDGKYLFFTSGRGGPDDIYWVAATVIERFRPRP